MRDFHPQRWWRPWPRTWGVRNRVELLLIIFLNFIFCSHIHRRLVFGFLLLIPRYSYIINKVYSQHPDVARLLFDGISLSSGPNADEVSNMKCNDCERRSRRWRRRSVTKRKRSNSRATTIGRRQSRHTGKSLSLLVVLSMVFFSGSKIEGGNFENDQKVYTRDGLILILQN